MASVSFWLYTPICQGSKPLASSLVFPNFVTAALYTRGSAWNGNRPYLSRAMKCVRLSAGSLVISSRGSVTCWVSKARLASKYHRISGGSVSPALLTTSRCPLRPHAPACCGNARRVRRAPRITPVRSHGWQMDHRCILRSFIRTIRGPQCTVPSAIEIIEHQAEDHPNKESDPIHDRQARHQKQTSENRENRSQRSARSPESTGPVRFPVSKNEHSCCHQCEREQSADIGQISESPDVEQARGDTHNESRHLRGKIRRLEARMHATKDSRKEPV